MVSTYSDSDEWFDDPDEVDLEVPDAEELEILAGPGAGGEGDDGEDMDDDGGEVDPELGEFDFYDFELDESNLDL